MKGITYTKHEHISLKGHPEFNEKWLQDRIAEDPTILGGSIFPIRSSLVRQEHLREIAGVREPRTPQSR